MRQKPLMDYHHRLTSCPLYYKGTTGFAGRPEIVVLFNLPVLNIRSACVRLLPPAGSQAGTARQVQVDITSSAASLLTIAAKALNVSPSRASVKIMKAMNSIM